VYVKAMDLKNIRYVLILPIKKILVDKLNNTVPIAKIKK